MCNMKSFIDELSRQGYKRGAIKEQIKDAAECNNVRTVDRWEDGSNIPDAYKSQKVAQYFSYKLNRDIEVSDIWPIELEGK